MNEKVKSKIAVVSHRFPFPDIDGAKIRVMNFIQSVYKDSDVYLFALDFNSINKDDYNQALKFCKEVHVFKINKFISLLKLPFSFLFSKYPIQSIFFNNRQMKKALKKRCFDVVYFNTLRTLSYNKYINKETSVLDFVDAFSMNYSQKKEKSNMMMNLFYYFEHKRFLNYELSSQNFVDKFIIISEIDKKYLVNHGFDKNLEIVGNYVKEIDLQKYADIIERNNSLTFMGKMSYEPNVSAVMTYLEIIEPKLCEFIIDFKLIVIGSGSPSKLISLAQKSKVNFTGFVDDPYEIITRSKMFIAPMVSGAGLQNKILEAMYIGKCVVTSKLGAEGLMNLKGDEIVIVEDINNFSSKVIELFYNEEKLLRIGKNARNYVLHNFSKAVIAKKYKEVIGL